MFYFSLAEKLGMSVEVMLNSMSSLELAEWVAYNRIIKAEYDNDRQQARQEAEVDRRAREKR